MFRPPACFRSQVGMEALEPSLRNNGEDDTFWEENHA